MMHPVPAGHGTRTLTGHESIEGGLLLIRGEKGAATKRLALGLGKAATVGGTADDAMAFVLGEGGE